MKIIEIMENSEKFSRLTALSKLGVVPNFADIQQKTVLIVGVGGTGSVAAEMLVRCGIGKLVLFDYDHVEIANMNRMFFAPDQIGLRKVDAASSTLRRISQDSSEINGINGNITLVEYYCKLKDEIINAQKISGKDNTLVLCCVDNYSARVSVNRVCLETEQAWIESGVSETAVSGHIQVVKPGITACFECAPPTLVVESGDESKILRNGVCAASLPTTMSIIAGLMVQTGLKMLLRFGDVSGCLGYNALTDFFPIYKIMPNSDCANDSCRRLQKKILRPKPNENVAQVEQPEQVIRNSNEWDIEVVSEPPQANTRSRV